MKKIINGKVYDTETAKELGDWRRGEGWRGFDYVHETLYRTKTGEFFLHGEGGPMTQYSEAVGQNSWKAGDRIMPMTFEEARQWAEEKLSADDYEEIFGEVSEDDSRQQVCYSVAASTVETVKRRAAELGISASEYIDRLVAGNL